MDQSVLKKLQQTELQILIYFDKYCKANNLNYYLIGGALLGSARYHGFIPWDDDIDVAMPRGDYEKLKIIWNESPCSDYFLQSSTSDPNFARCIMKLRKNGTKIVESTSRSIEMNNGIYIDIFPIDFLPEFDFKTIDKRANKIRKLMSFRAIKTGYINNNHRIIKKIIKYITFFISNEVVDGKIEALCERENNGERKYAVLFLHNYYWTKQLHSFDVFGKGSVCEFEGYEFIAPAKKEEFLTRVFGEKYLIEPPVNKRVSPHSYTSIIFNENDVGDNVTTCND